MKLSSEHPDIQRQRQDGDMTRIRSSESGIVSPSGRTANPDLARLYRARRRGIWLLVAGIILTILCWLVC